MIDDSQTEAPRTDGNPAVPRRVVVFGNGAAWIWRLAADVFPDRVEILDWDHAERRITAVAERVYGQGSPQAAAWRATQLDRLEKDRVDLVMEGLRFLGERHAAAAGRAAIADLLVFLTANRDRMRYRTFRAAGYDIAISRDAVPS